MSGVGHLVWAVGEAQAARAREGCEEGRVLGETHPAVRLVVRARVGVVARARVKG